MFYGQYRRFARVFASWPNPYAERLKKAAQAANLANRRYVVTRMKRSYWDEWQAAEDPCPARGPGIPHYAPSFERRRRCATCYYCQRLVFHR